MSETVDKVAGQLLASIEKSQNVASEAVAKAASASTPAKSARKTTTSRRKTASSQKAEQAGTLTYQGFESRNTAFGRLRWPD